MAQFDGSSNEGLRSVLDDKLFFDIDLTKSQSANVYVRESQYSHYTDAHSDEPHVDLFYKVANIDKSTKTINVIEEAFDEATNTTVKTLNHSNYLLKIFIRLEERVDMFIVSGYTLPELLS